MMYQNNPYAGVVPTQTPAPKATNWLPTEKYALLQKGLSQFKLSVTEEELAKGQCNHYNANGTSALIQDQDGSGGCTCAICGTHFNSAEFDKKDVENATQNILDVLNTIKIMYLSIDPAAALEYFQIIPFIEKIPALYEIAVNDFKKYEGVNSFTPATSMNPFNVFSMMMGGYPVGMQQPVMQQPMQAPMGYQPAPVMQQPVMQRQPGFNPMYGGVPAQQAPVGYQPAPQGYAFNPQGAAAPVQQPMVNTNMPPVAPQAPQAPAAAPAQPEVSETFKK